MKTEDTLCPFGEQHKVRVSSFNDQNKLCYCLVCGYAWIVEDGTDDSEDDDAVSEV